MEIPSLLLDCLPSHFWSTSSSGPFFESMLKFIFRLHIVLSLVLLVICSFFFLSVFFGYRLLGFSGSFMCLSQLLLQVLSKNSCKSIKVRVPESDQSFYVDEQAILSVVQVLFFWV